VYVTIISLYIQIYLNTIVHRFRYTDLSESVYSPVLKYGSLWLLFVLLLIVCTVIKIKCT